MSNSTSDDFLEINIMLSLPKYGNSQHDPDDGYKYVINCQQKVSGDDPDTRDWLELSSQFDHTSDEFKIFQAILEKRRKVVVKVGTRDKLEKEHRFEQMLRRLALPTFVEFFCSFHCLENFAAIAVEKSKSLCKKEGDNVGVIVMPLYEHGRIDKQYWTRENIGLYKSLLKHVICSLLCAYERLSFVHGDTHFGNILVKRTRRRTVSYGHIELETHGWLPVIMDFDRSRIDQSQETSSNMRAIFGDIYRVFSLAGTEVRVKLKMAPFLLKISTMRNRAERILPEHYVTLCKFIDDTQIDYVDEFMPPITETLS